ncbi:CRISPR-associated endonuclease Cas2 [Rhodanobacter thiooxydans]|uniref:CRISPR-associated endoribonuclease Cas2 n=1 Tax=Rhodanobacter thiooxydans TaxID=416169 RepID=A0A154QFN9_9GAMM|nr:CRISPR-associated endonuclease Cas2 [Rhodanobacter thiooxydans]EIL98034.1 CRISPR-associated protein Cas2 [Rhodanobacter thiooxydans LCS2]KZC23102.1 CRISPR-associated endonuclease Cas2 [Rhodanobacter thiooxydans]MCW0201147.1 CRISPR-associated endonuclease Cas2 [Rhodanobacter thiooxydans]
MMILVSYDVSTISPEGEKRLRKIAKACRDLGQRVQYSVFEVEIEPAQWVVLRRRLCDLIDPSVDNLRFYHLGAKWQGKVEHVGAKPAVDFKAPLIY